MKTWHKILETFWFLLSHSSASKTIMPTLIKYLPYCIQCRLYLCFHINTIWHNSKPKLKMFFIFQILHQLLSFSARVWRWFQNQTLKNRGRWDNINNWKIMTKAFNCEVYACFLLVANVLSRVHYMREVSLEKSHILSNNRYALQDNSDNSKLRKIHEHIKWKEEN